MRKHRSTALIGRVAGDTLLQMLAGSRQRTKVVPSHSNSMVGDDSERRIMRALRQAQQCFPDLSWPVQLGSDP